MSWGDSYNPGAFEQALHGQLQEMVIRRRSMNDKTRVLSELRGAGSEEKIKILESLDMAGVDHDLVQLLLKMAGTEADTTVRIAALRRIERLWPDPNVRRVYRQTMAEGVLETAGPVASILGRLHDAHARAVLVEVFVGSSSFGAKWLAFDSLLSGWSYAEIQDLVVGYFLCDLDEVVRACTVAYVGKQEDPSIVPELRKMLGDNSARVRANALEALTPMARLIGRSTFEAMLADTDHRVRSCAAVALEGSDGFSLEAWLEDTVVSRRDEIRASAAWVLRRVPNRPSRSRFLEALLADDSRVVQRQAMLAQKVVG